MATPDTQNALFRFRVMWLSNSEKRTPTLDTEGRMVERACGKETEKMYLMGSYDCCPE